MRLSARRIRSTLLLGAILSSAVTLLAWTQDWFGLTVVATDSSTTRIHVAGTVAAPDLSALSLAGLAAVAALTLSGPVLRIVFGVLQVLLGAGVALSSFLAAASPVSSSASAVTHATGVSGASAVAQLVVSVDQSAWPVVAIVLGIVTAAIGALTIGTARRWPKGTRRHERGRSTSVDATSGPVSDWDALSDGSDPTSR